MPDLNHISGVGLTLANPGACTTGLEEGAGARLPSQQSATSNRDPLPRFACCLASRGPSGSGGRSSLATADWRTLQPQLCNSHCCTSSQPAGFKCHSKHPQISFLLVSAFFRSINSAQHCISAALVFYSERVSRSPTPFRSQAKST
ncbi:hypothetical protein KIL84_016190 [Mauremys mutica]|uniref:Uncharacterized protein n=1 Tax=Mauremys mutica TaxID=74926 RepID=A0A9D3WTF9_9SAUR|nr:hypothetical protein KIL84_016190 [Mauremys mutica]